MFMRMYVCMWSVVDRPHQKPACSPLCSFLSTGCGLFIVKNIKTAKFQDDISTITNRNAVGVDPAVGVDLKLILGN